MHTTSPDCLRFEEVAYYWASILMPLLPLMFQKNHAAKLFGFLGQSYTCAPSLYCKDFRQPFLNCF
jgi:hypothetical protein